MPPWTPLVFKGATEKELSMRLDNEIKNQLKTAFQALSSPVVIEVSESSHSDQDDLIQLLSDLADCSSQIQIERKTDLKSNAPSITISGSRAKQSIAFRGIPGGHEFSSLVISILYVDGKAKQPDAGLIARIRQLKGPIRLRTYVSLTCENCPEVVQALNLMATLHPDFRHETIDGGIAQDEVNSLGIQGVPAIFTSKNTLLHSGKSNLAELLARLEATYGTETSSDQTTSLGKYDVVVIGGGPAGSSAAIYSARKGLKTALIAESLGGQLKETKGIENMISVSYTEGTKLAAQLNEHISAYPIHTFEHRQVKSISGDSTKDILLESGETLQAQAIIVATGAKWRRLGVPGENEHIGRGVAFCAHCDGPFYKGKRVAVVGGGNSGVEAAIDLSAIAEHVTLVEYGDRLKADDVLVEKLKTVANVTILYHAKSTEVLGDGSKVNGLAYENRSDGSRHTIAVDGVFVQIGLSPNSQFVKDWVEVTPSGEIVVDSRGRTSAPGIYAAGDVTTIPFKQIITAMGDGAKVALAAFEDRMRAQASRPSQSF